MPRKHRNNNMCQKQCCVGANRLSDTKPKNKAIKSTEFQPAHIRDGDYYYQRVRNPDGSQSYECIAVDIFATLVRT